jgi:hypothetical protein
MSDDTVAAARHPAHGSPRRTGQRQESTAMIRPTGTLCVVTLLGVIALQAGLAPAQAPVRLPPVASATTGSAAGAGSRLYKHARVHSPVARVNLRARLCARLQLAYCPEIRPTHRSQR